MILVANIKVPSKTGQIKVYYYAHTVFGHALLPSYLHTAQYFICAHACGWDFHYVCETGILNEHQSVQGETPGDRDNVRGSTFSVSVKKSVHVLAMHYLGIKLPIQCL